MYWAQLGQFLTYYVVSLYFIVLYIVLQEFFGTQEIEIEFEGANKASGRKLAIIFLLFAYISLVGSLIFVSLCYKNKDAQAIPLFYFASTLLGVYMMASFVMMIIAIIELLNKSVQN
jgi:hypothetical protein